VRQQAILQTALTENPLADAESFRRTLQKLDNPQFIQALQRVKKDTTPTDAFEPTLGQCGSSICGLGLPVCRSIASALPIGNASAEIDEVAGAFAKRKSAYVGYSPVLPVLFARYGLLSDIGRRGVRDPALASVRDRVAEAIRNGARCD